MPCRTKALNTHLMPEIHLEVFKYMPSPPPGQVRVLGPSLPAAAKATSYLYKLTPTQTD